jgi:hypothetical protein
MDSNHLSFMELRFQGVLYMCPKISFEKRKEQAQYMKLLCLPLTCSRVGVTHSSYHGTETCWWWVRVIDAEPNIRIANLKHDVEHSSVGQAPRFTTVLVETTDNATLGYS